MTKLRSVGEWDQPLLDAYYKEIEEIAVNDFQLSTYPNQLEIISSDQMIEAYSTHAMPIMYDHWRYGKSLVSNKNAYDKGHMNLAYEVVINSSPCIAYLMEENSITMQALVMAHACFGHNAFFKNNYLFKNWTDAEFIIEYLTFAKKYIASCEEKYGVDTVERFLDGCHALELHGVDKYHRPRGLTNIEKEKLKLEALLHAEKTYDDVIETTVNAFRPIEDQVLEKVEPQENILYFLEKNAPYLEDWQREVIRIVRKIAQYFYPQRQTQLINEGFATFTHYNILNRLNEKGLVTDGFMLEFLESHTAVTAQPTFDHPYYATMGINVYSLGFRMFQDIKRICMEPTAEDREYFPDFAGNGDWVKTTQWAMKNFRDESFILQFLSPHLIRKYRMFAVEDEPNVSYVKITDIHNKKGYLNIREKLAKMFDIMERIPNVQVTDVEQKSRRLTLTHTSNDCVKLDASNIGLVYEYLCEMWKLPVRIVSVDANGKPFDLIE
jgi:stage V sporulation protein R